MEHPFMTSIPFQQTLTAPSPCPDAHFFRKILSWATFASHIVCIYLASFISYKASKLTKLENVAATMQHISIWSYGECPWGLQPRAISGGAKGGRAVKPCAPAVELQ